MVAVDEEGKPSAVPEWVPETEDDIQLELRHKIDEHADKNWEEMEAHVKYLKW